MKSKQAHKSIEKFGKRKTTKYPRHTDYNMTQPLLNEGITQALIILILGIVIILSNLIVIATFINFRGSFDKSSIIKFNFMCYVLSYLFRTPGCYQHLSLVAGICGSNMWFSNCSSINLSRDTARLKLFNYLHHTINFIGILFDFQPKEKWQNGCTEV